MPDDTLTDDERKMIDKFRLQTQMDIRANWFVFGIISFFIVGGVIVLLASGEYTGAVVLALFWAYVMFLVVQKVRRDFRIAKLVTKLTAQAAIPAKAGEEKRP